MEKIYDEFISSSKGTFENDFSQKLFDELTSENASQINPFDLIFKSLKDDEYVFDFVKKLSILLVVFVVIYILLKTLVLSKGSNAITYAMTVVFSFAITSSVYKLLLESLKYISELSSFFGICSSAMVALSAYGGNVSTARTQTLFMSLFLLIVQVLINNLAPVAITFFISLAIIDSLWGEKKFIALSNMVKNCFYCVFTIATGVIFIIINAKFKTSISTDAMSGKTLKLLLSKAIPIVGGSVGDALNLIGGSLTALKNSVGTIATVFIISLSIYPFLLLFAGSILLNFFSFISDYFGISEFKNTINHVKCSVDFTIAASFMIVVTMLTNINLFMDSIPTVIA